MTWIIVAAVFIVVILLCLGAGLFVYACVRRKQEDTDEVGGSWEKYRDRVDAGKQWLRSHTAEKVDIQSLDGLRLRTLVVPHKNPKGTIIAMHGYRSRSDIDFSPQCEFLWNLGYNLLVVMQRSHDESEGKYITFGVKERFDCKSWVEYAVSRFGDCPIFLSGISMGCATVTMATEIGLPENVKGVIADCGYTSPWDIAKHVLNKNLHLPGFPVMYIANLFARIFAKFSFKEASSVEAMEKCSLPVLFIHGSDDTFVPTEMSKANYSVCASKDKKLVIIQGAAHAQSYMVDTEKYEKEVRDFIQRLNPGKAFTSSVFTK